MGNAIQVKNIVKRYPGTIALKGVDFELKRGEIKGLLGKNGAGKSTIINILAGLTRKTKGETYYFDERVEVHNVSDSEALGFRFISQEPSLMEDLSVAENIALREKALHKPFKFMPWKKIYEEAEKKLSILGLDLDPKTEVRYLKVAEKQMILFLREIFSTGSKIIALDEVTTAISHEETKRIYRILRGQKEKGQSFIYVSHEIDEIFQICDSAIVFRDGKVVLDDSVMNLTPTDLKKAIIGRELQTLDRKNKNGVKDQKEPNNTLLSVRKLNNKKLRNVTFDLSENETLGVYGLRGSGRTELLKTIYGLWPVRSGTIEYKGSSIKNMSPSKVIQQGIGFLPEDRKGGLLFGRSVSENLLITATIATKKTRGRLKWLISLFKEKLLFKEIARKFDIKTPSQSTEIDYLSGGNKQKVMLGRNIASDAVLLLIDEGTKGVDIGSKNEIYKLMRDFSKDGHSIIFTSSDLDEICTVSDRIIVMHEGQIVSILSGKEITKDKLQDCADGLN